MANSGLVQDSNCRPKSQTPQNDTRRRALAKSCSCFIQTPCTVARLKLSCFGGQDWSFIKMTDITYRLTVNTHGQKATLPLLRKCARKSLSARVFNHITSCKSSVAFDCHIIVQIVRGTGLALIDDVSCRVFKGVLVC